MPARCTSAILGFWLSGVSTTAVSVWNSVGGNAWAGVAITRRHVLVAKHTWGSGIPPAGMVFRFVTVGNVVVEGTVAASISLSVDGCLAVLSEDLPASIEPIPLLPTSAWDLLPTPTAESRIVGVGMLCGGYDKSNGGGAYLHPYRVATVRELMSAGSYVSFRASVDAKRPGVLLGQRNRR